MDRPEIGIYIDRTYKVVRQDLINRFKQAEISLTPEQWVLLSKLHEKGSLSQTELAAISFKDKPTVSRILDLLVHKGLVQRNPDGDDRRKFIIEVTSAGQVIIDKAIPVVAASREVGWRGLSDQAYEDLLFTLDQIFANYTAD
ncbi:MAG: MarR family winged helix-turn-helix transcriptional regulator [Cyclobacteriaceae bacterium]